MTMVCSHAVVHTPMTKVGNEQMEENIYDAFTNACIEAQKAPIFYPAVCLACS